MADRHGSRLCHGRSEETVGQAITGRRDKVAIAANRAWYLRKFIERWRHHDDPFGVVNAAVEKGKALERRSVLPSLFCGGRLGTHQRAIFEGVMFEHRRHVEVLASAGLAFERVALSGGGARSAHWSQIFADGLGRRVAVSGCPETGALGAALGAALALGLHCGYEEAVAAMTHPNAHFVPDPAMQAHYDRRYATWTALTRALDPIWREMTEK